MNRINRRRFVKAFGVGGLAYAIGRTPGIAWAQSSSISGGEDYKALVCLFLFGGNDSWNTVVPRGQAEYDTYALARQTLAVPKDLLLSIDDAQQGAYGFHPVMGGLRDLYQNGKCAIVANIGPLIQPVTKDQYNSALPGVPPQLFSHNDQQDQWTTLRGRSGSSLSTGWAGRVADILAGQGNGSLPLNISLAGNTRLYAAENELPYVIGPAGSVKFDNYHGTVAREAVRGNAFRSLADADYDSIYARSFADVQQRALANVNVLNGALASTPPISTPFPTNSNLATQLKTVARMIAARGVLGASRQIFFVAAGGFDTHNFQLEKHPLLLADVSNSLSAFYKATEELGVSQKVTTFTQSDFGRTLTSNGDGTDHAWGGVQFVVGGDVQGGSIYGTYPELQLGGPLDIGGGRFIPTVSSDQYTATLVRWLGLQEENVNVIAPSLKYFDKKDLGFFG